MVDLCSSGPPKNERLAIFIHVFVHKDWDRILNELLGAVESSGMLEGPMDEIRVRAFFTSEPTLESAAQLPPWVELWKVNPEHREWSTLEHVHRWAKKNDGYALYMHTKGVYRRGPTVEDWRRMMTYFCVTRWRDCIKLFDDHRVGAVGCNLRNKPPKAKYFKTKKWEGMPDPATVVPLYHFSGNFWWARSSAVRPLSHPMSQEAWDTPTYKGRSKWLASERWIGTMYPHWILKSVHQSGVCHYMKRYPESKYVARQESE